MNILETAIEAAKKNNISIIIAASTTGDTASKLFELVKTEKLRLIVVTHDEGRPIEERRFNQDIRRKLLANNITVYTHNPSLILVRKIISKLGLSSWHRYLSGIEAKYGPGIKVCHIIAQMLIEGKVIREGKLVAIAGTRTGADSAAVILLGTQYKMPILKEIIFSPNISKGK